MNLVQRDNLAKYCYDLSKVTATGFIIANLVSGKFSVAFAIFGAIVSIGLLLLGYYINRKSV